MTAKPPQLPKRLWHVEYEAAVGFPEPTRRERKLRNYTSAKAAGRQVAIIAAMPSHLALVSVHVSGDDIEWSEIDPATLPVPEQESDDENGT